MGRALSRHFSIRGTTRDALPRSARSCSCGSLSLFFRKVRARDLVCHTSLAGTSRLRSSLAWRKKARRQTSSSTLGASRRKQVRKGTSTTLGRIWEVQDSISLEKDVISSEEAFRQGSLDVRAVRNCWAKGTAFGGRPRREGMSVTPNRLLCTREFTALSRKLVTRFEGEDSVAWRTKSPRQLGGMDLKNIFRRSMSCSMITGFQRALVSRTVGTNCSLATSSRENSASCDQKSIESAKIVPWGGWVGMSSRRSMA